MCFSHSLLNYIYGIFNGIFNYLATPTSLKSPKQARRSLRISKPTPTPHQETAVQAIDKESSDCKFRFFSNHFEREKIKCPYCDEVLESRKKSTRERLIWNHCTQTKCDQKAQENVTSEFDENYDDVRFPGLGSDEIDVLDDGFDDANFLQSLAQKRSGNEYLDDDDDDSYHVDDDDNDDNDDNDYNDDNGYTFEDISIEEPRNEAMLSDDRNVDAATIILNARQAIKFREALKSGSDPKKFPIRYEIFDWQGKLSKLFKGSDSGVKFRNCNKGGELQSIEWLDLAKIYEFGVSANFSDAQGTLMLQLFQDIFDRHPGTNIQLRSTWGSLKEALQKQKVRPAFDVFKFDYPLPAEYFGTLHHLTQKQLKPFRSTGINILCIAADLLLNLKSNDILITEWREDSDTPRAYQILDGYGTGDTFKKLCEYYETFSKRDGLRVVPILFELTWDDTTTSGSQAESECPVYVRLVNVEHDAKEYELVGFVPRQCPYSLSQLHKQLESQGYDIKAHRVAIA